MQGFPSRRRPRGSDMKGERRAARSSAEVDTGRALAPVSGIRSGGLWIALLPPIKICGRGGSRLVEPSPTVVLPAFAAVPSRAPESRRAAVRRFVLWSSRADALARARFEGDAGRGLSDGLAPCEVAA